MPAAMADEVAAAREKAIEAAADVDDAIANAFLEGAPIEEEALKAALRKATIACKIVPVLAGAALRNKGVQPLLDAVCDYLPSPLEVPPMVGTVPGSEEPATRPPDDTAPFSALAFKVAMDEGRKVVYLRIYSGVLKAGDDVQNARTRRNEKVARLFSVHADRRERIERAGAGSIVVAMGLKDAGTGDTLSSPKAPIIFERIDIYEPVIARAIEPKTQAEKEKLDFGLAKLADEDPTFRFGEDAETGQMIIREWASFTWTSSSIACASSTASKRPWVARRSCTARRWPNRRTARRGSSGSSRTRPSSATRASTSRRARARPGTS